MSTDAGAYPVGTPITDGVRTINFFNGRLLAAEDLRREQGANQALRDRLGLAAGDGIVSGLQVSVPQGGVLADPVVAVTAGVAVNRRGTALALPFDMVLSLARGDGAPSAPPGAGGFAACSGLADGAPLTVSGVYLLTVAPAAVSVGQAPVSGLGNEVAGCNTDASAEGVRFRAVHLGLDPALLADTAHARNRLAHLMFGTADPRRSRLERDPFGTAAGPYGLLDDLRATCLTDEEVPLACVFWTPGPGIRFVDQWSVRRRLMRGPAGSAWPEVTGDRRLAEGEAAFLQFQAEIRELAAGAAPTSIAATERFQRLPAAGLLPLAASGWPRGFDALQFFSGLTTRPATTGDQPIYADAARVELLLRASFAYPPIDLSTGELVWLYQVRQSSQATPPVQPYVLFASGFLPYVADAQFNLARFGFANYALRFA